MPRPIKSARAKPGSNSRAKPPPKAAPPSPQFTESQQSSPPSGPPGPENRPDSSGEFSPDELSLGATEPFPPGLFRVPIPDAVFAQMPELSDSALRCLLALVHLSFRFDPEESNWVHPGDWFSRQKVEEASGLSDQGARDGLSELESLGWAEVDRRGRSHQYKLLLEVPERRFTYVPTALLEQASDIGSGTALRVVLAVLRRTWGWTCQSTDPESGQQETVHDCWAQLSNQALAEATGRSETAVRQAARALRGDWIERVRPGNGAYQYRFLPERIGARPEERSSFSGGNANDLTPDRQNSDPPSFYKESFTSRQNRPEENSGASSGEEPSPNSGAAVPPDTSSRETTAPHEASQTSGQNRKAPPPDFSDLSPEKRDLAEKLANVGLWAGRIAEVLSRFSTERIRVNFQLYRQRAAEKTIRRPGAWLYTAITEGYALPDSEADGESPTGPGTVPSLEHKETVSEAEKEHYVAQGVDEERFHRCQSGRDGPDEVRFMYFDPEKGSPERRV